MKKYPKIGRNPEVSWNQPTVAGTRLTVYDVVSGIKVDGLLEYMQDHDLKLDAVKESVNYCKELYCQNDKEGEFCNGCILSSIHGGFNLSKDEIRTIEVEGDTFVIHNDNNSIYLGTPEEYVEQSFGRLGWVIAEEDIFKYKELSYTSK